MRLESAGAMVEKRSLPIPVINLEEMLSERNVSKINHSFGKKRKKGKNKVLNLFANVIEEHFRHRGSAVNPAYYSMHSVNDAR